MVRPTCRKGCENEHRKGVPTGILTLKKLYKKISKPLKGTDRMPKCAHRGKKYNQEEESLLVRT